jgi:hypothetical protein
MRRVTAILVTAFYFVHLEPCSVNKKSQSKSGAAAAKKLTHYNSNAEQYLYENGRHGQKF